MTFDDLCLPHTIDPPGPKTRWVRSGAHVSIESGRARHARHAGAWRLEDAQHGASVFTPCSEPSPGSCWAARAPKCYRTSP